MLSRKLAAVPQDQIRPELKAEMDEAEKEAFLGYVVLDLIDPDQVLLSGYINGRPVNKDQARALSEQFKLQGCNSREWPLYAAVEDPDCFVDKDGQPVQCSKEIDDAKEVRIKPGARVWRIAGGHRTEAVRLAHQERQDAFDESLNIKKALETVVRQTPHQASTDLEAAEGIHQVNAKALAEVKQWGKWLIKIFSKRKYSPCSGKPADAFDG